MRRFTGNPVCGTKSQPKLSRWAATPDEFVEGPLALVDLADDGKAVGIRRGNNVPGGERERKGYPSLHGVVLAE